MSPSPRSSDHLFPFLLLSLLVHLALLAWIGASNLSLSDEATGPPPIVVALEPPREAEPAKPAAPAPAPAPAVQAKQIVSPSDQENELPPVGPAYLSDRDNRVEKETLKRGNPEAGEKNAQPAPEPPKQVAKAQPPPPPAPPKPAKKAPAPRPQPQRQAKAPQGAARALAPPLPGMDRLLPPPGEVMARIEKERPAADDAGGQGRNSNDPRRDLMSAPPPAPGMFSGLRGNFDHLPDVSAGQLTMLNTKADRFAPFVRRVGTRVFQNMLIYQRRDLDLPDILAAHEAVTVRAILDKAGKLKSIEVVDHSGSTIMDRTLLDALRQAAFDPNPPAGAANDDGEFEFIFQAQILASIAPGVGSPHIRGIESRLRIGLL